ncbi:alpha/beta fold hydrolase [Caulobacter sp. 602-1]|uniref:alpha/beta fold hydrolase n=1 Tax=Caulobacter sp. 602-1 TaxID=2492472 RepID=UPI000F634568|nr:alpha/beta hydrolase [Caulobacter sp. 602-1]RRN63980.1 alpha/beta hydrolase [Caulobacter sp. 602-1]
MAASPILRSTTATVTYHRAEIDGVDVFYRQAGPKDAPVVVLLHGFPSSSRMFGGVIPLLAVNHRVIAPDYPGFGHSDAPPPDRYAYSFDQLARTVDGLLDHLGVTRCVFLMQDYGGPVGFRLAMSRPDRVQGLIIQNANAYHEGLGAKWAGIADYWRDPESHAEQLDTFLSFEGARRRHIGDSPNLDRYDPDSWTDEFAGLSRPGQREIQASLLFDYQTNVAAYPQWQAWLRARRPPTLVLWGRYDPSFVTAGAEAYRRDLPDARIHLLDAGHFAFDEALDEAATVILDFLAGVGP